MPLDWRSRFVADDGLEVQPPAGEDDVRAAEAALAVMFPTELRELYRVSNGVFDGPGQWFVVWPLADVVAHNRADWSDAVGDSQRLQLVGFGDDGAGAPFCVSRSGRAGVFVWSALDDEAVLLADTLVEFWTRWQADSLPRY